MALGELPRKEKKSSTSVCLSCQKDKYVLCDVTKGAANGRRSGFDVASCPRARLAATPRLPLYLVGDARPQLVKAKDGCSQEPPGLFAEVFTDHDACL